MADRKIETAKPDAPIRPDSTNPDTNANVGESKVHLTSSREEDDKWAAFRTGSESNVEKPGEKPTQLPSDKPANKPGSDRPDRGDSPNKPNQDLPDNDRRPERPAHLPSSNPDRPGVKRPDQELPDSGAKARLARNLSEEDEKPPKLEGTEHNEHPLTAGSREDRLSGGTQEYTGNIRPGVIVEVAPLNGLKYGRPPVQEKVIGKVISVDVVGLSQILFIDTDNSTRIAWFKADDATIIQVPSSVATGKKMFINDDQTYDSRELHADRPLYEKQYVEKQEVLKEQTAASQFRKSLDTK